MRPSDLLPDWTVSNQLGVFLANHLWWEELHIISHHSPFTVSLSFTIALELQLLTPVILLPNSSQEPQSWPVDPGRKGQRDSVSFKGE